MKIVDLQTEYHRNPLGISVETPPRFSWRLETRRPGAVQRAYRLEVASSQELLRQGKADKYDSNFIAGDNCTAVEYAGLSLHGTERCCWRVSVLDERGRIIRSGEEAWFECALSPEQWVAGWIGCPGCGNTRAAIFRRVFFLRKPVTRARLYLAGLGLHEPHLNGQKLGDRLLEPAWTDYSKRILYSCFDITNALRPGENIAAIWIGNGWFGGPQLLAQIMIWYEDGTQEIIPTGREMVSWGDDWEVVPSAITRNSFYHGETFDARLEYRNLDVPGSGPLPAECRAMRAARMTPPGGIPAPMELEPIRIISEQLPISVREVTPGIFVFDFGINLVGWCALRLRGVRGQVVTMKFAELLHDDGLVDQGNLRSAEATDVYICRGREEEELGPVQEESWEPRFTYHGFRYVQLEGVPNANAGTLTARIIRSAVEPTGTFRCSHPLLNRICENARRTEAGNLHSIPTDCPQRDERMGWLNDLTSRAEAAMCHFNLRNLYAKFIDDIADTCNAAGAIADTAPFRWGGRPADPVSASFVLLPWLLYVHYGDIRPMQRHYGAMKKWFECLESMSEDGILPYSVYGDWAPPATEFPTGGLPCSARTPGAMMSTGFYLYHARILHKVATVLGHGADAGFFQRREEEIAAAFQREFHREDGAGYGGGNQASNAFALWLGIVPEKFRKETFQALVDDLKTHRMHITTGNLCTRYLFEVLTREGRSDLAVEILSRRDYPSYGYMIANGATTIWERWEKGGMAMNSCNHPMYGSICWWFYRYLAGISLDEQLPGAGRVRIEPVIPPQLTSVTATLQTVRGKVAVTWRRQRGNLALQVVIPPSVEAAITLPGPETEPGKAQVLNIGPGKHGWTLE